MEEIGNISCDENILPKEQIKNLSFEDFLSSEIFHTYYDLGKEDISFDADTQFLQSYGLAPPSIVIDRLQKILLSLGYLSLKDLVGADRPVDEEDVYDASQREVCYAGVFGGKTQTAVESFQIDMKEQILGDILVDGIVGPETKTLLYKAIYKQMIGIDMASLGSIPNFDTTHNNMVLSEGNLQNNSFFMAGFDLNIHSDSGVQDTNASGSNIDEIVEQMIANKKIDKADVQGIMELDNAFKEDAEGKLIHTKEALKSLMLDVLAKGYEVKGVAEIENLQRVLNIAGLGEDFVVKDIYEANRKELQTPQADVYGSFGQLISSTPAIEPEDKGYTFALKNGQLKIYEHQDWDINGNDIVGYVIPGDSTMISVNNWTASEDDLERDNHYVDTKKDYTENLQEALYKDTVRGEISGLKKENESLREKDKELEDQIQALVSRINTIEAQVLTFQKSIGNLEAQAGDMKQDIDNLQAKVDYLLSEQTALLQRIATLETGVQATKENLQDLEKLVTEIQLKCEQVEKELGQLQRKYDLGAPVIDSLRQEKIDQFNTEIVKLENDIKAGDNSKQELQARLDEIKKLVPLIGMGQDSIDLLQKMIDAIAQGKSESLEEETPFSLHDSITATLDGLPIIDSKQALIDALKTIEGKRFPQMQPESNIYAYIIQCAVSHLGSSVGSKGIDAWWGTDSKNALKQVQENVLDFTGNNIDGVPGPKTVAALLEKLQTKDTQVLDTQNEK